jgi:hypothetical protein
MANILTVPAGLVSATDQRDRSCKLTFETRELENSEFLALRDIRGSEGWLAFALNPIQESDIPKSPATKEGKTPSQRLRSVLFLLWKKEASPLDFNIFYDAKVEAIIEKVKLRLD